MIKNSKNNHMQTESKTELKVLLQSYFEWVYENLEGNAKTPKALLNKRIINKFMVKNGGTAVKYRPVDLQDVFYI